MPFILKLLDIQQKELLIDKKNREKKPITNREVELFDNYMTQLIADNTRAKISSASNLPNLEDFKFSKQIVKNKTVDNFEIFIPSFDKKIFKSEVPDYLALFTDLFILKYNDDKGLSVGRGSETSYSLEAGLEYVLWDVKNMRVASYGRLNQKIKLLDTPAKEDYLAIFEKFAISIIQQSPFATKKIYF
ncbi:MAG: hypothetical protein NTX65_17795 [Ignavibacteriales bacterium]|nr:hypothetical protein [Ignavibacteriales bacterium]